MTTKGLTRPQIAAYWRAATSAAREAGVPVDEYRKRVMREECGVTSVKQLNRTHDFDAVMRRFAVDSGDFESASRFAIADDARKATLVRICCAQVLQLKGCVAGTTEAADYLAGIVEQARVPCGRDVHDSSFWMDCNPAHLLMLFRILDTHRRRLLRHILDSRTARTFLGFDPGVVYHLLPTGGLRLTYDSCVYDLLPHIKIVIRGTAV